MTLMPAPDRLPRLSRRSGDGRPAAPIRLVHLGLGNFFRAHQAAYTAAAPDAADWGIAAFTQRSTALPQALTGQDGLFAVISRSAEGDRATVVDSLSRAHPGAAHRAWLAAVADPAVAVLTLTVTEAGYLTTADGHLEDTDAVQADLAVLRADPRAPVATMPARLVAGLLARRAAAGGPLAVLSCDNLPANGAVTAAVVGEFAARLDPSLADRMGELVSFPSSVVDRITPATTDEDIAAAARLTGRYDAAPVVGEPFTEWVITGDFPAGRPDWAAAGVRFVADLAPFQQRKLALLNGGHSLLAYAGSARGHATIAEAVADPVCRGWLEGWWDEAARHLPGRAAEITGYRRALLDRFDNPRIEHRLAQIAKDGSGKIGIRVLPTVTAERAEGRAGTAGLRIVAAWIAHLRGAGAPVTDSAAPEFTELASGRPEQAVRAVLGRLAPKLASDPEVIAVTTTLLDPAHEN